jgi:hypothetical protein
MRCEARVVLDSTSPAGGRLITLEVTFPRIVLAEFNTHRVFSRNSASSRAIPVEKMLKKVEETPFIPTYWGKNQKGMSAEQELSAEESARAEAEWNGGRTESLARVRNLQEIGVHKQITNRLLEPFLWHTVIVSSTEWSNFIALRDHPKAQPEIKSAASAISSAIRDSEPQILPRGAWHLPLVTGVDETQLIKDFTPEELVKISSARCARVSYLTHAGVRDPQKDIEMHNDLHANGHMSPFEHPAMALDKYGWKLTCQNAFEQWFESHIPPGNFWGFAQYRKQLLDEHDFGRIKR